MRGGGVFKGILNVMEEDDLIISYYVKGSPKEYFSEMKNS